MKTHKLLFTATIVMGFVAFAIVIFYHLALVDIWHENDRPDFWHGQGPGAFEWKAISILFWPLLLFFAFFFLSVYQLAKNRKKD